MKRILIAILLLAAVAYAQQPKLLSIDDLKLMIADRDIQIEVLSRQVRELQSENESLRNPK